MKNRGMGFCFQPKWKDKKTGEVKKAATWMISYSVRGQRHKESTGSTNKGDAIKLLKRRITDAGNGTPVGSQLDKTTLADLIEMLLDNYKANGRASIERARYAMDHVRDFFGADCRARDVSTDRITSYQAARLEEGAKPATINVECAMLRRSFRLASKAGKVGVRPEFDMLQMNNARSGFFEADQYRAVLDHLPEYLRPVITTAFITGWRTHSELLTRQWRHLDLANGWLSLDPGEGKTKQPRQFPLTGELKTVLEAQRERVRSIEHATGQIVPWVFCHDDGSPIRSFRTTWKKASLRGWRTRPARPRFQAHRGPQPRTRRRATQRGDEDGGPRDGVYLSPLCNRGQWNAPGRGAQARRTPQHRCEQSKFSQSRGACGEAMSLKAPQNQYFSRRTDRGHREFYLHRRSGAYAPAPPGRVRFRAQKNRGAGSAHPRQPGAPV